MTESYKAHLIDSLRFTKETVAGNWIRGSILLFLSFFYGLLFAFRVLQGGMILLILYVFVLIVMAGYSIRIFRSGATPPSFAPAGTLIKDGLIALMAVWIWCIPSVICIILYAVSHSPVVYYLSVVLLILPIIMTPLIFFGYAITGKFIESTRFSKILSAIRTPGWGGYLAACGVWLVCFFILTILSYVLYLILFHILPAPFAPSVSAINAFFVPILYVFTSRFFAGFLRNHTSEEGTGAVAVN